VDLRNRLGTYLIVTAGALLIWLWAASETREQSTLFVRVRFAVSGEGRWQIDQPQVGVTVKVEGSVRAIGNADAASRQGVTVVLPAEPGPVTVDLIERLRLAEIIRAAGVTLLSAEPAAVDVTVDRMVPIRAAVRHELPPLTQTEGPVEIDPPTATVWAPTLQTARIPETLVVSAPVDQDALEQLEPGVRSTVRTRLQLPESIPFASELVVEPLTAAITLTVRSRVRRTTRESVRVQLAGPHEDFLEYDIRLTPSVLHNVTIEADSETIRQINAGEATVVAMLHLSNREKEQSIAEKAVAYFLVLREGWVRGQQVLGWIEGSDGPPVISLSIERR
jgi:hypothetical protein